MTFTWSPAIKEAIESNVFTEKFYDFMKNWVVSGLAPSDNGSGILGVATGTCWVNGWRVEVTVAESIDISSPDGTRYVYVELTKDGAGKVTAVALADYGSPQTEDIRILIATPLIASGSISAVNDARQYDPFETTLIRLKDDVGLDAWQHTSDLGKIDGAEIYDASIVNAAISPTADIEASKILLTGTTQLSEWRHASDLTKIDGGDIYTGTVTDTQLATISWSKISKTGSNLNEIVTRSHTVLSDKGSNTHPTIDSHITTANSHFGDTSSPHGSSMSISTKLTTPKVDNSGDLTLQSTSQHVYIRAETSGKNIYLIPSGKIYLDDDIVIGGNIQKDSDEIELQSTSTDHIELIVECTNNAFAGGFSPNNHESGHSGGTASAWWSIAGRTIKYGAGGHSSYSARDDLEDLRAIKEYEDDDGNLLKVGEHGDGVWDARTIPEYIRDKTSLEEQTEKGTPEMAYMDMGHMHGWTISLLKRLDKIDVAQDEKLIALFNELVAIKSRLDAIEQA